MTEKHVCDCTGPNKTCPTCGYRFEVPRLCVSIEIFDGTRTIVNDGFNCWEELTVIAALERAISAVQREMTCTSASAVVKDGSSPA